MNKSGDLDYLEKKYNELDVNAGSYIPPWNATGSYISSPAVYYTASSLGAANA